MKRIKEFFALWNALSKEQKRVEFWFMRQSIRADIYCIFTSCMVTTRIEQRYASAFLKGLLNNDNTLDSAQAFLSTMDKDSDLMVFYFTSWFGVNYLKVSEPFGKTKFLIKGREV